MTRIAPAVAGAIIVLLAGGCGSSQHDDKARSLQSRIALMQRQLAVSQRHISDLQHDLSREQGIMEAMRANHDRAVQELEGMLRRAQSSASTKVTASAGR